MTVADPTRIVVDDAPLTVGEIVAVAQGAPIVLGPVALDRIAASRAVVDGLVSGDQLIYGLNTGLGHMRDERVPVEILEATQAFFVRAHAGSVGPALPKEVVRAAIAVRVAGIARGGSGASPEIAATYAAMLNAGVHPIVSRFGSVGASDLMHMAAIGLVAMGEGEAELDGERLPGAEAMSRAGVRPVKLAPKDGLTVISANGVSIGQAALVVDRATNVLDAADVVLSVSLEATRGNPSIVETAVALAKPVVGQTVVASRIREFLAGSLLCSGGAASVQDPLSFRVVPQVHGATREVLRFARESVDGELAAIDDNPLVSISEGRMISNGNFHPILMALAIDALRPALAHVGQLSDRRTGHMWDALVTDPAALTPEGFERLSTYGSPLLRYSGAARAAELRLLADPATLDVVPLDVGVEDHSTNAPLAVRRTDEALDIVEDLLAVELLTATALLAWRTGSTEGMGPRTKAVFALVATTLAALAGGTSNDGVHRAVRGLLGGQLEAAAWSATGEAGLA